MKFAALLFMLCICGDAVAQPATGITHQQDTSFSTYSAYLKAVKQYPAISIVPELSDAGVSTQKNIVYSRSGIRALQLDAFYPAAGDSSLHTAIIIIHGGGWRSGNRQQHAPLAQQLAMLGYTCFTPEYRLSTEAIFPAAIQDIKSAIRWVKAQAGVYNIDTLKIAVVGFSAGGQMAAFTGATGNNPLFEPPGCTYTTGSSVQAVVDIDGILSFVHPDSKEGDDSKKISAATHWLGAGKKDNPQLWQQASPLTWVSDQTPPTLFINSSEVRMHAGREDYIKKLNQYGIYSAVKVFDASPHTFCLFHPWFNTTVSYIDSFLHKVFYPKQADPEPHLPGDQQ